MSIFRRRHRSGSPPTVIFVNGLGLPQEIWLPVVEQLHGVDVMLFDRDSHDADLAASGEITARDLLMLALAEIDQCVAECDQPPVLVGHSYGGMLVEAFARLHPDLCHGVVLVDATLPDNYASATPVTGLPKWRKWLTTAVSIAPAKWRQPVATGMLQTATYAADTTISADIWQRIGHHAGSDRALERAMSDDHYLPQVSQACKELQQDHPLEVPVVDVVAVVGSWPMHRYQHGWVEEHKRRLGELGKQAKMVDVPGSHLVMLDSPSAIADAICRVREQDN